MAALENCLNDLAAAHYYLMHPQISERLTEEQKKLIFSWVKDMYEKYFPKCDKCYGWGIIQGQYLCRSCVVFKNHQFT